MGDSGLLWMDFLCVSGGGVTTCAFPDQMKDLKPLLSPLASYNTTSLIEPRFPDYRSVKGVFIETNEMYVISNHIR